MSGDLHSCDLEQIGPSTTTSVALRVSRPVVFPSLCKGVDIQWLDAVAALSLKPSTVTFSEIAWRLLTLAVMMVTFITAKGSNDRGEDVMLHT